MKKTISESYQSCKDKKTVRSGGGGSTLNGVWSGTISEEVTFELRPKNGKGGIGFSLRQHCNVMHTVHSLNV